MLTDQAGAQRVRWAPLADLNLLALGAGLIIYKEDTGPLRRHFVELRSLPHYWNLAQLTRRIPG